MNHGVRGWVLLLDKQVWNYYAIKYLCLLKFCPGDATEFSYITVRQTVHTKHFIIVTQKATCFGYARQPSSGLMFQKYNKEILERKA